MHSGYPKKQKKLDQAADNIGRCSKAVKNSLPGFKYVPVRLLRLINFAA